MERIQSLYPQYQRSEDRRKNNIPVAVDRRSGKDRRSEDRVSLDKQLTKDLFEVKSNIAKLETLAPSLFSHRVNSQSPTFASKNNMTEDMLYKEAAEKSFADIEKEEERLKEKASDNFRIGVVAAVLAGSFAVSFMGTSATIIAIGAGAYVGIRVLKEVIAKELRAEAQREAEEKERG